METYQPGNKNQRDTYWIANLRLDCHGHRNRHNLVATVRWNHTNLAEEVMITLACMLVTRKFPMMLTQMVSVLFQLTRWFRCRLKRLAHL